MSKFCRLYMVQSMGDICELNLNWVLPPMVRKYKTKPLEYLSYVIGAEGRGSLIAHLRKHRLALFLTAEVEDGGICSNSIYTIFTICISLTEEGRQDIKDIITRVFCYLKMLRTNDASEDVYNELREIADTNFRFNHDARPVEHVTAISQNMTIFPPEDYLTGWALFYEFSPQDIESYVSKLIPSRANILLHMKNHDVELDKEERWFKTKYRSDEIPKEWIREWEEVDVLPDFSLPRSNPYLPTTFRILSQISSSVIPEKIAETELYEVWHKGCTKEFKIPYASVNILINIPKVSQSAENTVQQMLFSKMITYQLIDDLYYAHVAQIEVLISSVEYGMEIAIYGFSEKMPKIMKTLAEGLAAFKSKQRATTYVGVLENSSPKKHEEHDYCRKQAVGGYKEECPDQFYVHEWRKNLRDR
uniref:Nardilysin n=1 Tax=Lygus hesperus TaxID=30085 RepID=A0A0A9YFX1_LYGHE